MNFYLLLTISIIVGYLIGSIPFALLVGKLFYKIDVRNYGSHNMGATNVGRTLGAKAGLFVLLLDSIKSGLPSLIIYFIALNVLNDSSLAPIIFCFTGISVAIGHCYPIFANFKGGKAVATIFGFLVFSNYKLALIAALIFVVAFLLSHIVSISSLSCAFILPFINFIPFIGNCYPYLEATLIHYQYLYIITIFFLAALLIIRHIPNIKRIIHHEEKKFHFGNINNIK